VWATHFEPTNPAEVSFTPNMTPITFSDLPPLVDTPPSEFILFPPPEENATPRRQPHSKKKPENHIPRPPNAFILFRSSFIKGQHVSTEVETNHSTLSKIIGLTWQNLPEEERQVWHVKAKEALDEHKRKFPKYAFRPVQTKAKGAPSEKRKVREVEPKDLKRCTKIAQLLVEGKKGHELDAAIQEFDKHHVPEIVTRFEAPITARAYRRSSSAPIPDTENSRAGQTFLQKDHSQPSRKLRAASTRPTRCSTPASPLADDGAVDYLAVDAHTFPLKQEGSFNFNGFSFDNVNSSQPAYECDPLSVNHNDSFAHSDYTSELTIDTSFMNDWASSPSPHSPSTPNYMASSSPMSAASPAPSYSAGFDVFDRAMDKSFNDISAHFPVFEQSCNLQQSMNMCGGVDSFNHHTGPESLFASYSEHHQYGSTPLTHLDLDFSAFMNTIPQYAM
ncbi:hypothetical protein B0H34DRAFT_667862, partial [Crassisporium funariophilum]